MESWNFKHILSESEGDEISWNAINKTIMLPQLRQKENTPFWLNSELISKNDTDL